MATENQASPRTVPVNVEYLAFLHDQLAENQMRLRELLGESQARAIFCISADKLVSAIGSGRYKTDPMEGILARLSEWGFHVTRKEKGDVAELEIKCPLAETVHPRLTTSSPKCPLGEYVLGAIRLEDSKSQLLTNDLLSDGVKLKLQKAR
jgi:hypothetical protein